MLQTQSPLRSMPAMLDRAAVLLKNGVPSWPQRHRGPLIEVQLARRVLEMLTRCLQAATASGVGLSLDAAYAEIDTALQSGLYGIASRQIVSLLDDQALAQQNVGQLEFLSWVLAKPYLIALGWRLLADPNLQLQHRCPEGKNLCLMALSLGKASHVDTRNVLGSEHRWTSPASSDSSLSLETGHPSPTLAPLRQSIMGSADLYHHDEAQLDSILLDARRSTVNSTASWNAVQSANAQARGVDLLDVGGLTAYVGLPSGPVDTGMVDPHIFQDIMAEVSNQQPTANTFPISSTEEAAQEPLTAMLASSECDWLRGESLAQGTRSMAMPPAAPAASAPPADCLQLPSSLTRSPCQGPQEAFDDAVLDFLAPAEGAVSDAPVASSGAVAQLQAGPAPPPQQPAQSQPVACLPPAPPAGGQRAAAPLPVTLSKRLSAACPAPPLHKPGSPAASEPADTPSPSGDAAGCAEDAGAPSTSEPDKAAAPKSTRRARKRKLAATGQSLKEKRHYLSMAMKFTNMAADGEPGKVRMIHKQLKQFFSSLGVEYAGDCHMGGCIAAWVDVGGLPENLVMQLAEQLQETAGACAWLQLADGSCFKCSGSAPFERCPARETMEITAVTFPGSDLVEVWGQDLVSGSEKPADIWATEAPARLERKRKRPRPVPLLLVEAFHAASPDEEDLLVLKLPDGLQGDIMLEAVRMNCQRTAYLEFFHGRCTGMTGKHNAAISKLREPQAHSSFKSKLGRQRTSKEHGAAAAALQQAIMDDRGPDLAGLGHGNADGAIVIEEALLMSFPSGTQNAQPWHVDPSTIQLCERDGRAVVLGDSRLGKVCKVHLTAAHRDAALKVFGWGPGEAADMLQCAHRVLPDLQALSASHIVPVLGAFVGSSHLGVVTELQPNGDLWSALLSGSMQWGERAYKVAQDVAAAVHYMHQRELAIPLMKSSHVLLDRDWRARMSGLDSAWLASRSAQGNLSDQHTSPWFPEAVQGSQHAFSSNMFSFGVLLWQLVTGDIPVRGRLRPIGPGEAPAAVRQLIKCCLEAEPEGRPTAAAAVQCLADAWPEFEARCNAQPSVKPKAQAAMALRSHVAAASPEATAAKPKLLVEEQRRAARKLRALRMTSPAPAGGTLHDVPR